MHTLKSIRNHLKTEHEIKIDFRKEQHTANNYGLNQIIEYEKAEKIVRLTLQHLGRDNSSQNVKMILDELQIKSLKHWLIAVAYRSN